jgi:UDP-glucose 4-epimerase
MTELMMADMLAADSLSICVLRYFNVAGADPQGRTGQSTPSATHLIKVACQVATGQRPSM